MAAVRLPAGRGSVPGRSLIKVAGLPTIIKDGPFDIAIVVADQHWAAANSRWGEFSSCEQCIRFQDEFPSSFKVVDIVLHEVGHAICWAYGIQDEDKEERVVATMATAWTQVWRDNPVLLSWMTGALHKA